MASEEDKNGKLSMPWSEVRKIAITLLAIIIIPWSVWITKQVIEIRTEMGKGERFTLENAQVLEYQIKEWHTESIEKDLDKIDSKLDQINKELGIIKIAVAKGK